jgi:hypothetical protein
MNDPVNNPSHYCGHASGVEAIEIVEGWSFCLGNAFKYLFRCGHKNAAVEDLRKARWYVVRELQFRGKRCSWFTGESGWSIALDGRTQEREVFLYEDRYEGHMANAFMWLIEASHCPRGRRGLGRAMEQIDTMIAVEARKNLRG